MSRLHNPCSEHAMAHFTVCQRHDCSRLTEVNANSGALVRLIPTPRVVVQQMAAFPQASAVTGDPHTRSW